MWSPFARRLLAIGFLAGHLLFLSPPVEAHYITGSEDVSGSRTSGIFGWNYSYTRSFDGTTLLKHLEINFVFDDALGYTDEQEDAYRAAAEANIEAIWNNKYVVQDTDNGTSFAVAVDVTTEGPFNQTVNVRPGNGPMDMLNWYVGEEPVASVQAHEFGHMLGLFDEYDGGAVDPDNPILSEDGLMGNGARDEDPVMYARYYQQYLDYMSSLNEDHQFSLVAVPEPPMIILLSMGGAVVYLVRRRYALWIV